MSPIYASFCNLLHSDFFLRIILSFVHTVENAHPTLFVFMSLVHAVSIHKHLERMVLRSQETNPIGLADSRYSLPDQSAMARKQGHKYTW